MRDMGEPAVTPQQAHFTSPKRSSISIYRELAVGQGSYAYLCYFELCTLFLANLPGLLGLGLRSVIYPTLLGGCGKRPAIGRSVLIRNPKSIQLGSKVLVDDYAALDCRSAKSSLLLEDLVSIGRFTTLAAKEGEIVLRRGANIGSYCRIATQSKVEIGESVLVAAYCYIGPGNHQQGDQDTPLIARKMDIRGGVKIGAHAWIGAHSTILDGVTIGANAIVGAHSLVKDDVPDGALVAGIPAKRIR